MKKYDLSLPPWGPYNKKYLGTAHIADKARGYRFDVNLFPGYYRRSVMAPRDVSDCGAKVMAASVDLSRCVYRYELEWKDRVYIDADFCSKDNIMTVTCDFVNETDVPESLTLNTVMSMQRSTDYKNEIVDIRAVAGQDTHWIDGADYKEIYLSQRVANDGLYLGECRGSGFVGGSYIGSRFFGKEGDSLVYRFPEFCTDKIGLRYRGSGEISLKTDNDVYDFTLSKADEPQLIYLNIPKQSLCGFTVLPHNAQIDIDGFVLGENISFDDGSEILEPQVTDRGNTVKLKFGDMEYTVECDFAYRVLRKLHSDDFGVLLGEKIHDHVSFELGNGKQTGVDLFVRPVFVAPHSRERLVIRITAPKGDSFATDNRIYKVNCNSEGEKFTLSQNIMSAVTLSNVVWPIYSRRGHIRHNTPGKNWDSLYTWDSGFIGMGLSEIDTIRAEECLNAYLTPVGDKHSPYIFHGSPVPTQIFLFAEIYNKTGDKEFLKRYYAMVRQQYRFLADARLNGRAKETGLFSTWDIFYNSGGWDDYPTQVYIHKNKMEATVCPMVNVSVCVLCAKILKMLAGVIGEEVSEYDEDIAFYSNAVNTYAWDEESGYYGYVNEGEILKIDGVNGDMGLDGAYPYIAGISDEKRSLRIFENIKKGMFTEYGVSVVDIRAPYYRTDGYWNGSVWMPHQWILWKAFLDKGETDSALYIVETALNLWENEVSHTYNCYEHFMLKNGRGAGFHQFSGLSTPVLMWFNALYKPYSVTAGFTTLISEKNICENNFSFKVNAKGSAPAVIVCLPENREYKFETAGEVSQINKGAFIIKYNKPVEETVIIKR